MSWKRTKHKDKQPGTEEKEGMVSRHLDAVATSTLYLKQLRHQLKGRSCRDNIRMSRQPLYREVVATTSRCRDNHYTEKLSRQHQDVATTIIQRSCRDNIRMSRQQLYREEVATTPGCRDNSCKEQNVATSISCRDVSFNEERSRKEQAVATPPSRKTCRNNTEALATTPATSLATRTATSSPCRDSISLLGQFTKVQKEMHRN